MTSLLQDLGTFGGGVFLTRRGIESRVTEATLWSAFEKPVVVWVHGPAFDDSCMARLIEIARRFPHIRRFRFTSTRVTPEAVTELYDLWPGIPIEGVVVQTLSVQATLVCAFCDSLRQVPSAPDRGR